MNRAIEWFARNPVAANLLLVMILAGGVLSLFTIKKEVFPEFNADTISVSVVYLGAAPEEVEEGVCVRVEEALQGLEGIKRLRSTASENVGRVLIEVEQGADTRKVLDEVKARVDAISTFPEQTEQPVIQELLFRSQVINVAVSGDADERTLKHLGERVRDEILDLPGISQVELTNVRPYEISIEVSETTLRRYNLSFDEVVQAVRRSSLDLPGGSIKTDGGEILFRTKGQAYRGKQFEDIVLRSFPDGTRLKLGEVANIVDGFEDTDQSARFDGKPAVMVQVFRVGDESALEIKDAIDTYIAKAKLRMPEGIELTMWQDDTKILKSRLDLMVRNGRAGFILVFLSLAIFLRLRLAFWVSVGLAISFLGAFWVIPYYDVSINLLSLFAFIVVLGIVVDDAIVVGENIYAHVERGESGVKAAIAGAKRVGVPVVFAVLTTVAAFSPLLSVPGNMGKFMRVIPIIVIATLLFSLLESLFILPAHLRHLKPEEDSAKISNRIKRRWRRFQDEFARRMNLFVRRFYAPSLEFALNWRYGTIAVGIATFVLTIGLAVGGWVKFNFFPNVDADNVVALLTMPQGTPADVTAEAVQRLEASALVLKKEMTRSEDSEPMIEHILASTGEQPFRVRQQQGSGRASASFAGAHIGEVNLQLMPSEERDLTSPEIAKRWRGLTGPIPDAVELVFSYSLFSAGEPINIQLAGSDYNQLQTAAQELKAAVGKYPGVFDVTDSYRAGKQEVKLKIKPEAESLGLTLFDLARQVRQAFYGEEAQRIQRNRDDVRVMVRYPEEERRSLSDLENMRLRVPGSAEVPFSVAAEADLGRGYAAINRTDRKRTISVTANVDDNVGNANEIMASLQKTALPAILDKYPSVSYSLEGQQREQQETMAGLFDGYLIALLLIYILLAIPFKSYSQPIIVMSAIPFGIVGAIWGHVIMGMDLTILSMFGIVALAGVVVNDSLVMVDFINRERANGLPLATAIREAGIARFRAILLTSLTTFLGLTPLLLERSLQAQFLIPMAISLGFGVIFATFITLVLVPVGYYILEDGKVRLLQLVGKSSPELDQPETQGQLIAGS
ncbi:efflux RND transporter permease subunit [candidate division KSB1 bacterium]|nr:efflux RND transporter permease subunit [candidate division KSB1 bacterium]